MSHAAPEALDQPATSGETSARSEPRAVPGWYARFLLFAVLATLCCGGVGLALADRGEFSLPLALLPGSLLAVLLTALAWRQLGAAATGRADHLPAAATVALALADGVVNLLLRGRWVITDRDPGVYATTALWLLHNSGLTVSVAEPWASTGLSTTGGSSGLFEDSGTLTYQFNHLLPVLMAEAARVFGPGAVFGVTPLLGAVALCALYAVGVRVLGRPWLALVGAAIVGVGVPWTYVVRSSLSEPVMAVFVWTGLWLLLLAWDRRSQVLVGLASLVLTGAFMVRVDALFYVSALPFLAGTASAVVASTDRRFIGRAVLSASAGALLPAAVGLLDLLTRTGNYIADQASQFYELVALFAASVVAGAVVSLAGAWRRRRAAARPFVLVPALPVALAWLVGIGLAVAWALRPVVQKVQVPGPNALVSALQRLENVDDIPTRGYDERTMVWVSWYLGAPLLAAGVIGVALMTFRALRRVDASQRSASCPQTAERHARAAAVIVLGVLLVGALAYLWRPSISPDQPWASRRFVVAVLPLFTLGGLAALHLGIQRLCADRARLAGAATVTVAVVLVAFALAPLIPIAGYRPRPGFLAAFLAACDELGPHAAVLVPPTGYTPAVVEGTLRSTCDVPVTAAAQVPTAAELRTASASWAARGRTLWVVDTVPALGGFPGLGAPAELAATNDGTFVLSRLTGPAEQLETEYIELWGAPVSSTG